MFRGEAQLLPTLAPSVYGSTARLTDSKLLDAAKQRAADLEDCLHNAVDGSLELASGECGSFGRSEYPAAVVDGIDDTLDGVADHANGVSLESDL